MRSGIGPSEVQFVPVAPCGTRLGIRAAWRAAARNHAVLKCPGGYVSRSFKLAIVLAISAIGVAVYFGTATSARSNGIYKIDQRVRQDLAANGQASVVIYLRSQADVSSAYGMSDHARGAYVYRTLKE